jgi:hypothetical protein
MQKCTPFHIKAANPAAVLRRTSAANRPRKKPQTEKQPQKPKNMTAVEEETKNSITRHEAETLKTGSGTHTPNR